MPHADDLVIDHHHAATRDGWLLHLKRTCAKGSFLPNTRPVLIVPGYGMNAFIFGFHPAGTSMERCLAEAGFEVWSVNLRGQGRARAVAPGAPGPSLLAHATADLPAALTAILGATRTGARQVGLIGCSLGGSLLYAYLALCPEAPVAALNRDIAEWIRARDLVLGQVNVTQAMARVALPLLLVLSNRDGIVPPEAVLSARSAWGGADVEVLRVGDEQEWYAHADLFIARESPQRVFAPIARWLHARG